MRLIDRDTLNEMLSAMLEKIGSENITWDDAMATIDHADDVDAIPVEWIKKWALDHYPFTAPTLTVEVFKHMEVMRMIEDWEQENARNNSEV